MGAECGGYEIKIKKGNIDEIKEIIAKCSIENWANPKKKGKRIFVDFETYITFEDYDGLFLKLCEEIATAFPESEFEGESYYTYTSSDEERETSVKYKNGALKAKSFVGIDGLNLCCIECGEPLTINQKLSEEIECKECGSVFDIDNCASEVTSYEKVIIKGKQANTKGAKAPGYVCSSEDFKAKLKKDGSLVISKYIGWYVDELRIPEEIDGYPVTEIGPKCFNLQNSVESLYIPGTVMKICHDAFDGCQIKNIYIANGVKEIERNAFSDNLALKHVELPNTIDAIYESSFFGCFNLKKIIIPEGIREIKDYAFRDCSQLEEITLPNTLISIGEEAFADCRDLQRIVIPASVKNIGNYVFAECAKLKEAVFKGNPDNIGEFIFNKYSILYEHINKEDIVVECQPNGSVEKYAIENNIKYHN